MQDLGCSQPPAQPNPRTLRVFSASCSERSLCAFELTWMPSSCRRFCSRLRQRGRQARMGQTEADNFDSSLAWAAAFRPALLSARPTPRPPSTYYHSAPLPTPHPWPTCRRLARFFLLPDTGARRAASSARISRTPMRDTASGARVVGSNATSSSGSRVTPSMTREARATEPCPAASPASPAAAAAGEEGRRGGSGGTR